MYRTFLLFGLSFLLTTQHLSSQEIEGPDTLITLNEFEIIDIHYKKIPYQVNKLEKRGIDEIAVQDVGDFLRSVPNVSGIRKGGNSIDPVVRGLKYSQLNVQLNNGQKIEGGCPNRMDPATAHIDIDDLLEIEIIKGPYALRYGPNFGGVINMKTIKPSYAPEFEVNVSALMGYESNWNGMKEHISVTGGNKNIYFHLSGNYKNYGNYKDGRGETVKSSYKRYNYTAQLGVSPVRNHSFIFSYDRSYGRDVLYPALPMDERTDDTHLLSLDYAGKISNTINSLRAKFYHSDVNHLMDNKYRPFSDTVVAISDIHAINYGYRAEAGINTGKCQLFFGTDFENIYKNGDRTKYFILQPTLPVKNEMLWEDAHIQNFGFFAEHDKSFKSLDLVTAIRLDLNMASSGDMIWKNMGGEAVFQNSDVDSKYTNFSISTGGTYHFSKKLSLSLAIGRGVRSPDMTERYIILLPIGYDKYDYLGNPKLKPEANNEIDLTLKYYSDKAGRLQANIFYSYITDYISGVHVPESEVKPQTKGVLGVKEFQNIGNVWLTGFELTYASPSEHKLGIVASVSYTMGINPSATKYIIENNEVVGQVEVKNDPLPEIPPMEGSISALYRFCKGKFVPRISVRMVNPQNKISESFYEEKTPGFVLADFSFVYNLNEYLSIDGGVKNMFNKAYYEHLNRRIIGSTENLYEPGRVWYISLRFKV